MATVSFSMSDELIERLDEFTAEHDYPGRSAVVREAARSFLEEIEEVDLKNHKLVGVITVFFQHETTNVERRLLDLRHEHDDLLAANVHNHVGNRYCMELFVVEGELEGISGFVGTVRGMKDTLGVNHSVVPIDEL